MQSYASLQEGSEPEDSGVLIHVVESSRSRWNHIEDLDSFFSRMYRYHQHSGFYVMLIEETLELFQFVFVVFLGIIILHGINYVSLFDDKSSEPKIPFEDLFYQPSQWLSHCGWITYLILVVAAFVWGLRLIRGIYLMFHYWDIKQFYNSALSIDDSQLSNLTWHEVQTKIRAVQLEQQMCIHKRELTELDIYHRILRQQNYFVAMANKRLLPPRLNIPFIGEVVYWTRGLRYNMQLLLFWGPWAPFQNPWHLREEYKKPNLRHELAHKLKKYIFWLAIVNLIFAPFVFLWQILYVIFSYAELVKREPGSLGIRGWSLYGRLYLRHFNELEHELQARLNRAYRPATRYLAGFNSPMVTIIARGLVFTISGILFIIAYLGFLDQDILKVSYYLPILAVFSALFACFRALIPDETMAWCPETLLTNVLVHTHYLPPGWHGQAHTDRVRKEFQQLLQYTFVRILDAVLNPILTPVVLITYVYPRALDVVDFFRNFTVSVVGVGDVCSFAQMDVRKHGNPEWQWNQMPTVPDQYTQAEDGKTELSLVHFTLTNPSWQPPPEAQQFVQTVQQGSILSVPERSSGDGGLHFDLNDSSTYGSYQRREGPPNSDFNTMSMSTRYLHDQHFRQVGSRYQRRAVETTPLLSN